MKFNVLVTTYEFVMYDRSKLSRIDWKYIIIDEAQRMKDRESVLARDLDRYRCQRRLLLTGTPLQVSINNKCNTIVLHCNTIPFSFLVSRKFLFSGLPILLGPHQQMLFYFYNTLGLLFNAFYSILSE